MAQITITICTDNAAFEDGEEEEVARILESLAYALREWEAGSSSSPLLDFNGNKVGQFTRKETA